MISQLWVAIMTSLSTIAIGLLGLVLACQHRNRRESKSQIDSIRSEMKDSVDRLCKNNDKEHLDIWQRVNHHKHNGSGSVIICD
jgi:hypothetical protein